MPLSHIHPLVIPDQFLLLLLDRFPKRMHDDKMPMSALHFVLRVRW